MKSTVAQRTCSGKWFEIHRKLQNTSLEKKLFYPNRREVAFHRAAYTQHCVSTVGPYKSRRDYITRQKLHRYSVSQTSLRQLCSTRSQQANPSRLFCNSCSCCAHNGHRKHQSLQSVAMQLSFVHLSSLFVHKGINVNLCKLVFLRVKKRKIGYHFWACRISMTIDFFLEFCKIMDEVKKLIHILSITHKPSFRSLLGLENLHFHCIR